MTFPEIFRSDTCFRRCHTSTHFQYLSLRTMNQNMQWKAFVLKSFLRTGLSCLSRMTACSVGTCHTKLFIVCLIDQVHSAFAYVSLRYCDSSFVILSRFPLLGNLGSWTPPCSHYNPCSSLIPHLTPWHDVFPSSLGSYKNKVISYSPLV